jgi:hypothetical protein
MVARGPRGGIIQQGSISWVEGPGSGIAESANHASKEEVGLDTTGAGVTSTSGSRGSAFRVRATASLEYGA